MAAGAADSQTVELELVPGTWTDITADVDWPNGVTITQGTGQFEDARPGQCSFNLRNSSGNYTADNPLSAYYPNFVEGKRIRHRVVKAATTYTRFIGWINTIAPASFDFTGGRVEIIANDSLGQLGQRTLATDWAEAWAYRATGQGEACDCFPMDDGAAAATSFRNLTGTATLIVKAQATGVGATDLADVSQGILLPGGISTLPNTDGAGPVLLLDLGRNLGGAVLTFALSTSAVCTAASPAGARTLVSGYDVNGVRLWMVVLTQNGTNTDLDIYDPAAVYNQWILSHNGDPSWLHCSVYTSGGNSVWFANNTHGLVVPSVDTTTTRYVCFGGNAGTWNVAKSGKSSKGPPASFAGIAAATTSTADLADHARPLVTTPAFTRATEIVNHYCQFTLANVGTQNPQVSRPATAGKTALEVMGQLVTTIGGALYADHPGQGGNPNIILPDSMRPTSSSLTITLEKDDDEANAPLTARRAVDSRPTRITVSSPFGASSLVDTAAEATGLRRDDSYDSAAASVSDAYSLAGVRLYRSVAQRFTQVAVDLVSASTDLWASVMNLRPASRITLASAPSAQLGYTSRDAFILNWTETWTQAGGRPSARFVWETASADVNPDGVWDSATYGRFALDDGSLVLANPITSGATSLSLAPAVNGKPVMTTAAGDYTLDIDLLGEFVTLAAAPSTSTRTNLCTNPSFETNTTSWATFGTVPTIARSQTAKYVGSWALQITWPNATAAASGVQFAATVTSGQVYTFSVWVYVSTGPAVRIVDKSATPMTGVTFNPQTTGTSSGGWVRLSMTGTAAATTITVGVTNDTASTSGQICYIDGALIEQSSNLGSYFDGAHGGAWTGTADASTSQQTIQTFTSSTRGVSPSVARAHVGGEAVQIRNAACWAMG